jgi:hypothetical protein
MTELTELWYTRLRSGDLAKTPVPLFCQLPTSNFPSTPRRGKLVGVLQQVKPPQIVR